MADQQEVVPESAQPRVRKVTDEERAAARQSHANFHKSQSNRKIGVTALAMATTALAVGAPTRTVGGAFPEFINNGTCTMDGGHRDGSPLSDDDKKVNDLKNRIDVPEAGLIDSTISIEDFLGNDAKADSKTLNQQKAATVTGYIVKVISGGAETCNCQTTDKTNFDTHIYLSPTPPEAPKKGVSETQKDMIVEVTPRMRGILFPGGHDWDTDTLHKTFKRGTKVTVTGWQFYDKEHEAQAFNLHGQPSNWRYSCWEIHPVTDIEVAP